MGGGRLRQFFLYLAGLSLLALLLAACGGGTSQSSQLAYSDADGVLWLVNADGSGRHKLADDSRCDPQWSPTGDRFLCSSSADRVVVMDVAGTVVGEIETPGLGLVHWSPNGEALLYWTSEGFAEETEYELFLADGSGETLAELGPWDTAGIRPGQAYRGFPLWSPDGGQLAYRSADTGEARIYSLDTGTERVLEDDYHPLGWALDGTALLVAANYEPPPEPLTFPSYEVNLLDLASGQVIRRLPELDSRFQFWVSPDGSYVAALTRFNEGMSGPGLATLNLQTGEFAPIPDSVISFPSEHIPKEYVTFSTDGSQVYWIDAGPPATVYTARNDGSRLTQLAEYPSLGASLSPDLMAAAYNVFDDDVDSMTLYIAEIGRPDIRQIDFRSFAGEGSASPFWFAWRPNP